MRRSGQRKLTPVPAFIYLVTMLPPVKQARMDGDTWWMEVDLGLRVNVKTKIRLKDYSAIELKDPGGKEAKAFALTALYAGKQIVVQTHKAYELDRPIYDRWEGAIWVDGEHLGEKMLVAGFAIYNPM